MQRQVLLALFAESMNDTMSPEGIVPSALVFGECPSLRTFERTFISRASLAERAIAAQEACRLLSKHFAQVQIKCAMIHQTPQATDITYQPRDKFLIWRQIIVENRISEWFGPYIVCSYDAAAKVVLIQKIPDSPYERFNASQVKTFLEPDAEASSFMETVAAKFFYFVTEPRVVFINMTEVINKEDPRAKNPEIQAAIMNEFKGLLRRGTFKVIFKSELPDGANALTGLFVLAIKSDAD